MRCVSCAAPLESRLAPGKKLRCPSCGEVTRVPLGRPKRSRALKAHDLPKTPAASASRRPVDFPRACPGCAAAISSAERRCPRCGVNVKLERLEQQYEREPLADRRPANGLRSPNLNGGVAAGLVMMLGAVVWFFGGLAVGIIFFYPPILFLLGLATIFKGLFSSRPTRSSVRFQP